MNKKIVKIIGLVSILFLEILISCSTETTTTLTNEITETRYDKLGVITSQVVSEYNEAKIIKRSMYKYPNGNKSLEGYIIYEWTGSTPTKESAYDSNNNLIFYNSCELNSKGLMEKYIQYNLNYELTVIYNYDGNENVVKATTYSSNSILSYIVKEYNGKYLTKETYYDNKDNNGNFITNKYTKYDYDNSNYKIKTSKFTLDNIAKTELLSSYEVYEYDILGNLIKTSWYSTTWDGILKLLCYEINKYDNNNNKTKFEMYGNDGVISSYGVITYKN